MDSTRSWRSLLAPLLVVCGAALPVLTQANLLTLAWLDLLIETLIAVAVVLIGQALVAYEVFTGKRAFDGKTEIRFLKTCVHCTMQCRIPAN